MFASVGVGRNLGSVLWPGYGLYFWALERYPPPTHSGSMQLQEICIRIGLVCLLAITPTPCAYIYNYWVQIIHGWKKNILVYFE